VWGLLAHLRPTSEALLAVGRRLIQDAIEPLETHARDAADPR
jgi:hypothetical protein